MTRYHATTNGNVAFTAEEETAWDVEAAEHAAGADDRAAAEAKEALKLSGIEILGVMCSATKEDQMGLTAVGLDYSMTTAAGDTFSDTAFSFENGSKLVITNENFSAIYNLWVPFRRSFFAPE